VDKGVAPQSARDNPATFNCDVYLLAPVKNRVVFSRKERRENLHPSRREKHTSGFLSGASVVEGREIALTIIGKM